MDGWAIKHRKRQEAPPAPKRKATHARRVAPAPAARLDDGYDWIVDGGPPVVDGGSANLTCRTTDAMAAGVTAAPVPAVAPAAPVAAPVAKPAASFEELMRKYPPRAVKTVTSDDGWLA